MALPDFKQEPFENVRVIDHTLHNQEVLKLNGYEIKIKQILNEQCVFLELNGVEFLATVGNSITVENLHRQTLTLAVVESIDLENRQVVLRYYQKPVVIRQAEDRGRTSLTPFGSGNSLLDEEV